MSPDDPSEPSGGRRRSWAPESYDDDEQPAGRLALGRSRLERALRTPPARGRRVRRTVRQIDPWSVLKLSLLFHAALFLIVCVASALLWSGARASGSLDNVESFITSVGGFGNCEPLPGSEPTTPSTTPTTVAAGDDEVDQLDPSRSATTDDPEDLTDDTRATVIDDDEDCPAGERLVGEFQFEDARIFQAFAFGGVVMVLAGTGATVVLVLLFNLMSDLTGGVQVTVIEEDARSRRTREAGSPPRRRRD
jgi:hypothetical protein